MRRMTLLSAISLAALWAAGCGGGATGDNPKTYPVTGTVTLKGAPVEGATVSFVLTDNSRSAVGKTDASGVYKLTTFAADDGAVPGDYTVSISKFEVPKAAEGAGGPDIPESYAPPDPNKPAEAVVSKNLLPTKYASATTSGFTAKVTDSGENKFDFPLE